MPSQVLPAARKLLPIHPVQTVTNLSGSDTLPNLPRVRGGGHRRRSSGLTRGWVGAATRRCRLTPDPTRLGLRPSHPPHKGEGWARASGPPHRAAPLPTFSLPTADASGAANRYLPAVPGAPGDSTLPLSRSRGPPAATPSSPPQPRAHRVPPLPPHPPRSHALPSPPIFRPPNHRRPARCKSVLFASLVRTNTYPGANVIPA